MILSIIEILAGLGLFYGTGVAIAKTVMFLNPDEANEILEQETK